ncbi:MAG: FAD:protein FMN transferase [Acidimicrobiales bacterium]|nr:FAD:protein FMN transferase [Acidimicrobiales bacterium]
MPGPTAGAAATAPPAAGPGGPGAAERRFRAMGTDALLVGVAAPGGPDADDLLARAEVRIQLLDARWSRFRPASELSRLNAAAGAPVLLPRDTYELVHLAIEAWRVTGGRFDPTVLRALEAAGYDRSHEAVVGRDLAAPSTPSPAAPTPGCAGIELDPELGAVTLPAGVALDLGGIGKGRTADLVVAELVAAGLAGALVDLGGDVSVAGTPPAGASSWVIGVPHPLDPAVEIGRLGLAAGGVVTSTRLKRAWHVDGRPAHHLIEPSTGRPADSGLASVTVLAATAAWAEVLAKAVFLAGPVDGAEALAGAGATGLAVTDDGEVLAFDGLDRFVVSGPLADSPAGERSVPISQEGTPR